MIIAQVCLRLATIKGHSKMCSFITQHNATDVANFEGAFDWHADCRNVHQSCWPWIKYSFLYNKAFQRIWQYIQPASQPQTTCNHTSPGPPHPASSPPRSSETSHPDSCCNNRFASACKDNIYFLLVFKIIIFKWCLLDLGEENITYAYENITSPLIWAILLLSPLC